jgi:hypothetical protein
VEKFCCLGDILCAHVILCVPLSFGGCPHELCVVNAWWWWCVTSTCVWCPEGGGEVSAPSDVRLGCQMPVL